jgi:glycosyltransferase involved in cell wall biosynthesis
MDILILTIGFKPNTGGLETHLTDLTKELSKRFRILVVTLPPISTKTEAKMVENEGNLHIWRIPWFGKGVFYKLLGSSVLEFFYLTPPLLVGLLIALIRYPEIKVIHAQGLSGIFIGGILGKLFRKRVIVSTHFVYHFKDNFFAKFSRFSFDLADRVLCVSLESKREMKELGLPDEKIGKCAYWIDLEVFKSTEKARAKKIVNWKNKFSVLFVGRLVKEKGILELIEAVPLIPKNINLYIIGDGPLKTSVAEAANKYSNVHFLGKVENALTPIYYSASDIVVMPSYEETLGRVAMEALACSTPVIASAGGGVREVVNETVGVLFEVRPEEIARAIIKLYSNPKLYSKLKNNSRKHIKKLYSKKNLYIFVKEYGF